MSVIQVSAKEYFRQRDTKLVSGLNIKRVAKPNVYNIDLVDKALVLSDDGWIITNKLRVSKRKK